MKKEFIPTQIKTYLAQLLLVWRLDLDGHLVLDQSWDLF